MSEEVNQVENTEEVETQETNAQVESETTENVDSDKVVEKLQKRIGKEQAEKNETKKELEKAYSRIEELEKSSKKSIKEQSEEDKLAEKLKASEEKSSMLERQLLINNMKTQADEVLKESGLIVGEDVLSLVVTEDEETTYSNVKAVINFLNDQRQAWEKARNTGTTPKKMPQTGAAVTKQQFDAMTYSQRAELATNNPELFKQITGGY